MLVVTVIFRLPCHAIRPPFLLQIICKEKLNKFCTSRNADGQVQTVRSPDSAHLGVGPSLTNLHWGRAWLKTTAHQINQLGQAKLAPAN